MKKHYWILVDKKTREPLDRYFTFYKSRSLALVNTMDFPNCEIQKVKVKKVKE